MLSIRRESSVEKSEEVMPLEGSSRPAQVPFRTVISKLRTSGYAFAFVSVLLAFVLRLLIDPWVSNQSPYITFIVAVAISGFYRGLRAAWLAAALGAAVAYFCFVPPRYQSGFQGLSDAVGFAVYSLAAITVILLTHARVKATAKAEQFLKAQIQAERKLLDTEALFQRFMDHSSTCAYLRDEQGRCLYANESAKREFGIGALESTDHISAAKINSDLREQDRRVLKAGTALEFIDRRPCAAGERYWLTNKFPFVDQAGRKFVGGISFDITASVQAEEILRKTERLSAAGQMASLLAHEINNPLAALTNFLFLLKERSLPSPAKELACRANEELTRINRIAAMTMGFYFENETPGPLRICQIINEVALALNSTQTFKHVQIKREFKCDPVIVASAPRIRQLIASLLTNALESDAKSVRVRVHRCLDWRRQSRSGVRVTISDDGRGIRPEIREKIFEPFFSTKAQKGTGLGLWASQTILLKNNGMIKVRSSISGPAKGTCVSFFWPTPPDRRVLKIESARIVQFETQSALQAARSRRLTNIESIM